MDTKPATSGTPDAQWDVTRKYVREVQQHDNGMVEFEFAVGEPGLFVEMVMPRREFEDFCAMHGVQPTQGRLPEQEAGSAEHEWDWSLHDARQQHFRHAP